MNTLIETKIAFNHTQKILLRVSQGRENKLENSDCCAKKIIINIVTGKEEKVGRGGEEEDICVLE